MTKLDPVSEAYKTFNKAIDRILKEPAGPARWRACVNLWLTFPGSQSQYTALTKENAATRVALNKFGVSTDKLKDPEHNLRNALALPHTLYYLIQRADPTAFSEEANAPKMFKSLKEFTTREVY